MLNQRLFFRVFLMLALGFLPMAMWSQDDAAVKAGKELFKANCASCHALNTKLTGPALAGAKARWAEFPEADLYAWIRNSQALVGKGHPRAVALFAEYKTVMQPFPNLKDADIANILLYLDAPAATPVGGEVKPTWEDVDAKPAPSYVPNWYIAIFAVMSLLAFVLYRIIKNLKRLQTIKETGVQVPATSFLDDITSKSVLGLITFALIVSAGYLTINNAIKLGRSQDYKPEQPINFSHAIHAGKNQIDCQYCHDGARRSKHSTIPGAGTCMNCHAAVKQGQHEEVAKKITSSSEILKIYAASGFNPNKGSYFAKDSVKATPEQIKAEYLNYLTAMYKEVGVNPESYKEDINNTVTKVLAKFDKPIEWIKIHNLPDHVYFNHAQHVTAGGLQCQTCHGEVEKMGLMKQFAPLSMGWCVNCHRKAEVRFAENGYYSTWERYHNEIKSGKRTSVTVEEIGGLECQKCHY